MSTDYIDRSPRRRLAVSAGLLVAGWAVAAAWFDPRGPLTSQAAITSMLVSLALGGVAGFLTRSRWSILLAPLVFVTVFEVMRIGVDGPMVDGLHASFYGALALITGRGFQSLLTLVPLALGAALGAGTWRARHGRTSAAGMRVLGRGGAVIMCVALAALLVGLARPATTAPILGPDGRPLAGSVAELTSIAVAGHELPLMIRGTSVDNPVLLFLPGGPGGSELGAMRRHLPALEEYFTVVTWDPRGAGTAYDQLDPVSTVTVAGHVSDTIAVTDYLRERFGQDDIYLLGQSWGSTLGVMAVQEHPERYRAFIGTGQMVSQLATDRIFYRDTLAWAQRIGDTDLVQQLQAAGPPPYDAMFPYETALSHEQDVYPYDHSANSEGSGQMSENLLVEEYTLIDQVHVIGAFMDSFAALYPQLQDVDFRKTATTFEVPVFFVQGAHEADGRAQPFTEWYPTIQAPIKDVEVLQTSGHRPLWEQPDAFVDDMVRTVLDKT